MAINGDYDDDDSDCGDGDGNDDYDYCCDSNDSDDDSKSDGDDDDDVRVMATMMMVIAGLYLWRLLHEHLLRRVHFVPSHARSQAGKAKRRDVITSRPCVTSLP